MIRPLCVAAVIVILCSGAPRSAAQPSQATPHSQAHLDEAERLDQSTKQLLQQGKVQNAIAAAERSAALYEQARGPMHLDVATSLNKLALLYLLQGQAGKAEPPLLRALA